MSLNRAIISGRLVKDVELKKTSSDIAYTNFTLAVDGAYKKDGDKEVYFINFVAWRKTAEFMANYVKKGTLLGVEGRIQTRNYKDQNDRTVYVTEVVCDSVQVLESKKAQGTPKEDNELDDFLTPVDVQSDELPF